MSKIELYLSKVVKYGLYAILLTPLAFWPSIVFPYLTSKFICFQILIEIVFGAWLILTVFYKKYRPKLNALIMALILFLGISLLSAVLGVDFSRSFWGIGPRLTGLFAELHFFAWFLVLLSVFSMAEDGFSVRKYLNFSLLISVLVALTAFYQNTSWGLVYGYGIFNNPTFSSPYLLFHFWWALWQGLSDKSNKRIYFFGAGALLLFVLFLAQIRGSIVGLLAGFLFFGLVLVFGGILKSKKIKRLITAGYILLILITASFPYWSSLPSVRSLSFFQRLTNISLSMTTAQTRLITWRVAFQGYKDRLWLGTGPENFNYLFNAHYNPELIQFSFRETWVDKPHNIFLQVLTETGIIGSAAYVFLWLSAAYLLLKLFRKGEKLLSIILGSAFISYLGTVFFSFDSFGSWFVMFLFLAFVASLNNMSDANRNTDAVNKKFKFRNISIAIVFICVFLLAYLNYSIWQANLAEASALRVFFNDTSSGLELFKKSLGYWTPYKSEYRLDMTTSVVAAIQRNLPLPDPENTINFALDEADKMIADHPKDAFYYATLSKLYSILGERGHDPYILSQAQSFGEKSLELSPKRQEVLFYLSKIAALKGDGKQSIVFAQEAVDVFSSNNLSHWYLALAYFADNQKDKAREEIKKSIDLGFAPRSQAEADLIKSLGL